MEDTKKIKIKSIHGELEVPYYHEFVSIGSISEKICKTIFHEIDLMILTLYDREPTEDEYKKGFELIFKEMNNTLIGRHGLKISK